jgi:MinD superfamily P-loop ATPase
MNPILMEHVTASFNTKPVDLPVIAVTGGKGGTGKTSVAVNLAVAMRGTGHRVLFVDADVDSPTAAIVFGIPQELAERVEIFVPRILDTKCNVCGKCAEACRPHALIQIAGKQPMFFEELCSGCEACKLACPLQAISEGKKVIGYVHRGTRGDLSFIGGELKPNEARSAQVVTAAKHAAFAQARTASYDVMIVDTSPGTHCNVVQALRGADLALAVTEPTPLGACDLTLILRLMSMLGIPSKVVVNKADLPGAQSQPISEIAHSYGNEIIMQIPVDKSLFESYVAGEPLVATHPDATAAQSIMKLADAVMHLPLMK